MRLMNMERLERAPRHHVLIAGQGRSGTSLLVRVLSACGLETHIERQGDQAQFDARANAGLENFLFSPDAPYVVKSPWSYLFLDHVLGQGEVEIDLAILPIRRLRDAAASRVITEIQERNTTFVDLFFQSGGTWEHFATASGGVVYSLEPLDQERILATGFVTLVEALVRHDVPIVFLEFPRFATDQRYLFDKLGPLLPADVSWDEFCRRVGPTIDPSKVRVEDEMKSLATGAASRAAKRPSLSELELVALRRALAAAMAERNQLIAERDRLTARSRIRNALTRLLSWQP